MSKITDEYETFEDLKVKDGGHLILNCSNCRKSLVDLWITRPKLQVTTLVRAKCCYCNDQSFIKEVRGGFAYSGIVSENDVDITRLINVEQTQDKNTNANITVFIVEKGQNVTSVS